MAHVRCPSCHEYINEAVFAAYEAEHRQLRADGQQAEYVTLPPEERSREEV
jgi:hypothetical protein